MGAHRLRAVGGAEVEAVELQREQEEQLGVDAVGRVPQRHAGQPHRRAEAHLPRGARGRAWAGSARRYASQGLPGAMFGG